MSRLKEYIALTRLDKPIGIWLLLAPTAWAFFLANQGPMPYGLLFIFIAGTVLMRSAGCVLNDVFDRHIDSHVARTKARPLARRAVSVQEALAIAFFLCGLAFWLVLFCNALTVLLAVFALGLAAFYPFMKRYIAMPQAFLGVAFAWGVPMAAAALQAQVTLPFWLLFSGTVLWVIMYDTLYAMVDREDDVRIGVKSSAIFFGRYDRLMVCLLQGLFLMILWLVGEVFHRSFVYEIGLLVSGLLFLYQQQLIRHREREACFQAFLNNRWVGLAILLGILFSA